MSGRNQRLPQFIEDKRKLADGERFRFTCHQLSTENTQYTWVWRDVISNARSTSWLTGFGPGPVLACCALPFPQISQGALAQIPRFSAVQDRLAPVYLQMTDNKLI